MKKFLFCFILGFSCLKPAYSQSGNNWQYLDLKADGIFGTSLNKAYLELLKDRPAKPVIVAVIDGGFDLQHELLKPLMCTNPREIAGNGKDDDGNGYADDIQGWNFLGRELKELGHGNHVAGVVANSAKGKVKLMALSVVPDDDSDQTDEHDAAAIRYAVNMGAKVINISYEKRSSANKKLVDDAVKYAMLKDVLIVSASGNAQQGKDTDMEVIYPNRVFSDQHVANGWMVVGASGQKDDASLLLPFSNYGKRSVDLFAPGQEIYSAVADNKYEAHSGTSMAAPIVAGIAGLIRAYFPELSAVQVKNIIMSTVIKRAVLGDKCVSGGVVNAYAAIKLAAAVR